MKKFNVSIMRNASVVPVALFVFVMMLVQSLAAQNGAVYYVSTTGNDSNPGTLAAPWLTIQHAANTVTAGATVNVMGGVYNGYVTFPNSGTASEPITFQSDPVVVGATVQPAVIDGTGLTVKSTQCLVTISGALSYITVSGFEIRNLGSPSGLPCGILFSGSGTGVQILNNVVHNINKLATGNGGGILIYGTSQTPITQLVVSGNELYDLQTGSTESLTLAGNVTNFQVSNNLIHDNDNIGIDIAGYWKHGPTGYDQPMYGEVSGNTIYNISGIGSTAEGNSYDADGLYCDGCAFTTFERNVIMQVDYGIETTSENQECQANGTQWSGPNNTGTAAKGTFPCYGRYATVRDNLFYNTNACGNSIGGYALATSKANSSGGGSSFHDVFVNNTLFNNGIQPGNDTEGTPSGEFQIQNQVGSAQDNYFENNAVYAGWPNIWINSYVPFTQTYPQSLTYPPPPATLNWNLYDSAAGYLQGTSILWGGVGPYTDFSNWQTSAEEDASSLNVDPQFVNQGDTPPNLDTLSSSPAVAAGSTSLSCSVGWCDPNGSSPTSIYGSTDFLGNPRTNGSKIDIGAYENTGEPIDNSLAVDLSSAESSLNAGQSTTLTVTVTALPGGGGAPSGTVSIMNGSNLLETATLMPTGVNTTAATMPLNASQIAHGTNALTAVYSGNSIAPCCTPSEPPGGAQTQVPWYPSATSAGITEISTAAAQVIAFTPSSPVTYGVAPITLSATGGASGNPVTFTYVSGPGTLSGLNNSILTVTGVGTIKVSASQAGNSSYAAATPVTASIVVNKAPLTVTANNTSKAQGAPNPTFTATYSGFVNGQNASVLSGAPSLTTTATTSSPAGTYPIVAALGTLTAANYTFTTFVNGTLSVITTPTVVIDTSATLTGTAGSGYTETVTVTNTGGASAPNVILTTATLGGVAGTVLPHSIGTLAANGGTATFTITFPGTAGADSSRSVEAFGGTYTGGNFSASARVVLP